MASGPASSTPRAADPPGGPAARPRAGRRVAARLTRAAKWLLDRNANGDDNVCESQLKYRYAKNLVPSRRQSR
jgi:hypothetical protein